MTFSGNVASFLTVTDYLTVNSVELNKFRLTHHSISLLFCAKTTSDKNVARTLVLRALRVIRSVLR